MQNIGRNNVSSIFEIASQTLLKAQQDTQTNWQQRMCVDKQKARFKLVIWFKVSTKPDGNNKVTYYSPFQFYDSIKKKHIRDDGYALTRLQAIIENHTGKFITAMIFTNDKENILMQKNVGSVLQHFESRFTIDEDSDGNKIIKFNS